MRLRFRKIDLRGPSGSDVVTDQETGQSVGQVTYDSGPTRHISLFGKYHGNFKTHEECVAFADGVEAVLNHMVSVPKGD
jgi:hypothetical protein